MYKKGLPNFVTLLIIGAITTSTVLIIFPFQPNKASQLEELDGTPINQFAFDFYSKMDESEEGNVFFSPYSIFSALAMTYEGAKGLTAEEMKSVFHFPEVNVLRPYFAALYNGINQGNKEYELKTGNALWVQNNFLLLEDYTSRVENYYGSKVTNLDFVKETEKSRQTINNYIENQTNDIIKDLIPFGALNPMTRMVLTNAIYFKGEWERIFDEDYTY